MARGQYELQLEAGGRVDVVVQSWTWQLGCLLCTSSDSLERRPSVSFPRLAWLRVTALHVVQYSLFRLLNSGGEIARILVDLAPGMRALRRTLPAL